MIRATIKSLLARKLRLVLSGAAVVLGVMFVSGAFVLTDTVGRSFEGLFSTIYQYTDIEVSKPPEVQALTGQPVAVNLPASAVPIVAAVPGVKSATGQVFTDGAKVIGKNGKSVLSTGAPRFGGGWVGVNELVTLRQGRAPTADTEIVMSANLATSTGYTLGDQVPIVTPFDPQKRPFTLVGVIEYSGGRDSLAGETSVLFTEQVAQQLMLGGKDVFNTIDVRTAEGANRNDVRDRVAAALGSGYAGEDG